MTSTQPSDMGLAHVTSVKTYATKETEISAMGTMYTMNERFVSIQQSEIWMPVLTTILAVPS